MCFSINYAKEKHKRNLSSTQFIKIYNIPSDAMLSLYQIELINYVFSKHSKIPLI